MDSGIRSILHSPRVAGKVLGKACQKLHRRHQPLLIGTGNFDSLRNARVRLMAVQRSFIHWYEEPVTSKRRVASPSRLSSWTVVRE
jgi:hypothetical protein